jgi:microsomal dipeptidase-like Zn-dependent dipeptidase/predicted acylesterase/phospholipase RssA
MASKLADLHCHYPMHVISGDDVERSRKGLHEGDFVRRLQTAVMWLANRLGNYKSWESGPRVTLDSLTQGEAGLVLSVLYWPFSEIDLAQPYASPPQESYPDALFEQIKRVERDLLQHDKHSEQHVVATTGAELDEALRTDRIAFVHCVEGGFHLGSTTDEVRKTVDRLADAGVAYITLAHLFWRRVATNAPAIPHLSDGVYNYLFPQETGEPLSELGVAAVEQMYRRNVLIDISHMRQDAIDATFAIVERLDAESGADPKDHPIIASHVGVRLRGSRQHYNLSRETVSRIVARGGVIGLIMAKHQLFDGLRATRGLGFKRSVRVITRHIDTLYRWTGSHSHTALGTDLDGFIKPTIAGIDSPADLPQLRRALEGRYAGEDIERIFFRNAHDVIRGTLHARAAKQAPPRSGATRGKTQRSVGLALSGGGHRAAFFHLGVLARLAELDRLRSIRVISTVSGGSIVGVLYYLHVQALLREVKDDKLLSAHYKEAVRSVIRLYRAAAARNLRGRALLDYGRDLRMASPHFSRTSRLAELYDLWFFRPISYDPNTGVFHQAPSGRIEIEELAIRPKNGKETYFDPRSDANLERAVPVPILLVNATTLNTGHSFRFSPHGAGEPTLSTPMEIDVDHNTRLLAGPVSRIPCEQRTVGTMVAASSAFPGGFAPLTLDGMYTVDGRPYVVQLTDGGVHDNQGVDALVDEQCEQLIVSDGSAQMADMPNPVVRIPALLGRVSSIAARTSREQRLLRTYPTPPTLVHLQSGLPVVSVNVIGAEDGAKEKVRSASPEVDLDAQRAIAGMRTDLDAFSDVEAAATMCLGYRVAGAVAHGKPTSPVGWWFDSADPELVKPSSPFMRRLRISRTRFLRPVLLFVAWLRLPRFLTNLIGAVAGLALVLVLVLGGRALGGDDVPALTLYASLVAIALAVLMYLKADVPGLRTVSRLLYDTIVPFVLAITGVLSLASVLFVADGALHRAWGWADRGMLGWAASAFRQTFTRLIPALIVVTGLVAAGLAGLALLLDGLVNVTYHDLVLRSPTLATISAGLGAALVAAAVLWVANHAADLGRALAVAFGVVLSAIVLVLAVLGVAWLQSRLGHRGGLAPSLTAAYLTMAVIAIVVALVVSACLAFALRRIARIRRVEPSILPVGMALVASVLVALIVGLRTTPASPEPTSAAARDAYFAEGLGKGTAAAQDLAERYQPVLRFDSHQQRRPLDVDTFLKSGQSLCDPDCHDLTDPGKQLRSASSSAVLNLETDEHPNVPPAMYFQHTVHDETTYLDYWVFYNYNDSPSLSALTCISGISIADATCFDHEGDWEGLTVVLAPGQTSGPPKAVIYAAHSGTALFDWDAMPGQAKEGERPVAWVAYGSHASYPFPCGEQAHRSCRQLDSDIPDGQRDGLGKPWNCGADCLKPFPQFPDGRMKSWATFPGRWGQAVCTRGLTLCTRSEGPPTPTYQTRFTKPWSAPNCNALLEPGGRGHCVAPE